MFFYFCLLFYFVIIYSCLSCLCSLLSMAKRWQTIALRPSPACLGLNSDTPTVLSIVYGCLHATTTELSSVTEAIWPANPKICARLSSFPHAIFSSNVWWFYNMSARFSTKLTSKVEPSLHPLECGLDLVTCL